MMQEKRSFPIGTLVLSALAVVGLILIVMRYTEGLGAVTYLTDGRAWGLWKVYVYFTIAIGAGAFTLAAAYYIFHIKVLKPIIKPITLAGFLIYLFSAITLFVDIGQSWNIWYLIIHWNIHSPLFEVGIAVMLYTIVVFLEFSPTLFERLKWNIPLRAIRFLQIPLVIAAIFISTGHHSSLGTMLIMMPETLHELWYTPILPILFFVSAVCSGLATAVVVYVLSCKAFGYKINKKPIQALGKAIPYFLGLYLILKVGDLAVTGELGLLFSAYPYNLLWWGEMIIGVVLPIILLLIPNVRRSTSGLFSTSVLVILGVVFNRFIGPWLALTPREGYPLYIPHWNEILISVGLVAVGLIIYQLAVRLLPIHSADEKIN